MNKNMFILPVSATFRDIKYPDPVIPSKEKLEKKLRAAGVQIKLTEDLSHDNNHLYAGEMSGTKVIVKHLEQKIPQTPLEFFIMADGHAAEAKVLKKLHGTNVRVPQLIEAVPKLTTNLIEDLREEKYENLADQIVKKKFPKNTAEHLGKSLAQLETISKSWAEFKTEASSARIYFTHSLALLLGYPQSRTRYEDLRNTFVSEAPDDPDTVTPRGFVWTESNPQHVMVNQDGNVAFVDFTESYFGDQKWMISSMIAHLIAYSVAGYIKATDAVSYLSELVKAYQAVKKIEHEEIIVQYIAMELLHVANGKDILGITTTKQSLAIQELGRTIFDKEMNTIKQVLGILKKV